MGNISSPTQINQPIWDATPTIDPINSNETIPGNRTEGLGSAAQRSRFKVKTTWLWQLFTQPMWTSSPNRKMMKQVQSEIITGQIIIFH